MTIVRTNNLGANSPISDLELSELDISHFSYGRNYILRDHKIKTFNGETLVTTDTSNILGGYVDYVSTNNGEFYLVAGRTGVNVFDGTAWANISNPAGYANLNINDELLWTGCKLGRIPIITNPQSFPEYWSPQVTTQKMQDLKFDATRTWRQMGYRAAIIRSHNNYLFALNLNENGIEQPNAYRWSHPADIDGMPFSWDATDLSSLAGKAFISDNSYRIVDAYSLRNEFCIYSSRSIHLLNFSNDEFVFNRRLLSNTYGCLATNCVVEAVGSHYVLTSGDIILNDGNSVISVLNKKIKRFLENSLSTSYYQNSFGVLNPITKEVWFFIVQENNIYPNIAIIINYVDGNISIRDIPGTKAYACLGSRSISKDTWESDDLAWTANEETWEGGSLSPFNKNIVALDNSNTALYSLEETDRTVTEFNTIIQRDDFVLGGQDEVTTITRMYPHIRGSGSVFIEMGSKDYQGAPIRWKPGVIFTPNRQRKVDIRTTGKLHSWRVTSIANATFDFTGFDLEYVNNGTR